MPPDKAFPGSKLDRQPGGGSDVGSSWGSVNYQLYNIEPERDCLQNKEGACSASVPRHC